MIKNPSDFEKLFIEKFGDISRTTLGSLVENKLRFELGGEEAGSVRINQALDRSSQILKYCFDGLSIWLRVILWDKESEVDLRNSGMHIETANNNFKSKDEEEVMYLYFNKYSQAIVTPFITSIINYEMAEEPCANITCYFIDFERCIIINVYDDRGMDVYSLNKNIIRDLSDKFYTWLI